MSLDVYLTEKQPDHKCVCPDCGHEHTAETWETLFEANITHNLICMADEAGLYDCLWRPDENDMKVARDLIEPMTRGLATLEADRARFEEFEPENGWGSYDGLVSFVRRYLHACHEHPDALVSVSR